MECDKCLDRGFVEKNHGLMSVFCDCKAGRAKMAEVTGRPLKEPIDDDNGTGQTDTTTGSRDTGKPKRTRKPAAKKAAGKKPR